MTRMETTSLRKLVLTMEDNTGVTESILTLCGTD